MTATLRLDRTRPFSTIHGERKPDDPHYLVHFWQDGLPFGADLALVPDNGERGAKMLKSEVVDGKERDVPFPALYTDEMAAKVQRKLKRFAAAAERATPAPAEEGDEAFFDLPKDDEINLEAFFRGQAKYEVHEVLASWKTRFHRHHNTLRALLDDAIYEERIIPEEDVDPRLLRILDQKAA